MKNLKFITFFVLMFFLFSKTAYAGISDMPWDSQLDKILKSLNGPVAKAVATCAILMTGLALAFGEGGGFVRRLLQIIFGLSIAFAASSRIVALLGFGGGLGM